MPIHVDEIEGRRIFTTDKVSTLSRRDVASSSSEFRLWHGCISLNVALSFLTTNLQNVTFDRGDLYHILSSL